MTPVTRASSKAQSTVKASRKRSPTWEPQKIGHVVENVISTKKTSLISFLVALLARLSSNMVYSTDVDIEKTDVGPSKELLEEMIRDAAIFCNDRKRRCTSKFKALLCE